MTERGYANIPKRKPIPTATAQLAEFTEPASMSGLTSGSAASMSGLPNAGAPSAGTLLR
jgi:hypothetical protein